MKTLVITGSTRGIGYAMAKSFLKKGCRVVISGRKESIVKAVVKELETTFPDDQLQPLLLPHPLT